MSSPQSRGLVSPSTAAKNITNKITDELVKLQHIEEIEKKYFLAHVEDLRVKIKKSMSTSRLGHAYNNTLLILSVLSGLQFVYESYYRNDIGSEHSKINNQLERIFSVIFMFDWCLSYFMADNKIKHFNRFGPTFLVICFLFVWHGYTLFLIFVLLFD